MDKDNNLMEKIVALCKRRGFIYPGSEIYGGLAGTWDYGPVGALLKKNLKDLWWKEMVQLREDIVGVDAAIMMNPKAWEASGHVEAFTDPLIECEICHKRFRPDQLDFKPVKKDGKIVGYLDEELNCPGGDHKLKVIKKQIKNIDEKEIIEPWQFNLLVTAQLGVVDKQEIYLRGEITNGVQVNFRNILDSTRVKIPFGIAQIGKAFRNEITPGNFTFRSREFEQMELQYYIRPEKEEGEKWFDYWNKVMMDFYLSLGIKKNKLRFKDHDPEKRAHYAKAATDIEYEFPWGWDEFIGIHNRGDWDLTRHQKFSGQDLSYRDPESGDEYIPWDIETSTGVDRSLLALLIDAYAELEGRTLLRFKPSLAPIKVAVFPLLSNKPELVDVARKIYLDLKKDYMTSWDDRGNIGKRYASQDEVGTPFCITVDFDTLKDNAVTVRDRDTAKQERVKVMELKKYLQEKIK